MKAIVLALSLLVSGTAFANYTSVSRINFQSASTSVPANKVCQANGMFFHKTKAAIAVDYCSNDAETNCTTVYKALAQPIKSTKTVCVADQGRDDQRCVATKVVAYNQSTVATVSTYRTQDDAVRGISPIKTSTFVIPACAKNPPVKAN